MDFSFTWPPLVDGEMLPGVTKNPGLEESDLGRAAMPTEDGVDAIALVNAKPLVIGGVFFGFFSMIRLRV